MQLARALVGPYEVWTWTQPEPPRVGRLDVSVAVMRSGTRQAVPDAEVQLTGVDLTQSGATSARAVFDTGWFGSLYQADLGLPAPGRWRITLAVMGPAGGGRTEFELEVQPRSPVPWWLIATAAVALVVFIAWWWRYAPVWLRTQ